MSVTAQILLCGAIYVNTIFSYERHMPLAVD